MPTYTYKCSRCSRIEDIVHSVHDQYKETCFCGGEMKKVFYPSAIAFNGSGFYSTDNRGK
jgi:putative FmdB family regulatory protein